MITSRTVRGPAQGHEQLVDRRGVGRPVSSSRALASSFSVTTSQVSIGPMYRPFWSTIALTEQLEELGADADGRRARQVARVGQQPPLVLGRLVEHVDRLADHLVDLASAGAPPAS